MAIRIYIDQGHNPVNPNAGAEGNGYREQDITYRIGQELFTLLENDPAFEARLSRSSPDVVLGISNADSLRQRVEGAEAFDADLFLSLHTNASSLPAATGSEALVFSLTGTAADIARVILRYMAEATGLPNRGVKARPGLYVLRRTSMPAIVLEMGFITNERDATLMAEAPGLFARGIYNGLRSYYGV